MKQELYFEIAKHLFVVETPDRDLTSKLLPSFRSFFVGNDFKVNTNGGNNILFRFSGNKKILIPKIKPIEKMNFEGTEFNVYQVIGGTTISMKIEDHIHYMFASNDYKIFNTDLTLTEKEESMYILFLLRAAYGMAAIHHQTIKIHASVTEKDGKALLF